MLSKVVTVESSVGLQFLTLNVQIPEPEVNGRDRNMQLALADRQAVFKNDCAACHAYPTTAKSGAELYGAACGICHDAEHRASMVPDLRALNKPTDRPYWHEWITKGKAGTLMPAFAKSEGGPLDDGQIQSLVDYLARGTQTKFEIDIGLPAPKE